MTAPSGYSNKKLYGRVRHVTMHDVGSSKVAQNIISKALAERTALTQTIISVTTSDDDKDLTIQIAAHGAQEGDVLRIYTGVAQYAEYDIFLVVDANNLKVRNVLSIKPAAADTAKVMFYITSKADSEGNVNFSPGPTTFIKNSLSTIVTQDTAVPANNKGLPSQLMIMKDGTQYPVTKDTTVPSNTVAIPVEIVSASGTTINVTAGDINIQLTDQGVNADKTRIGDGTNTLSITATGEAKTRDLDAIAQLTAINAAQAGRATSANQATEIASLASIDTKVTGISTAANQATSNASLASIDGKFAALATSAKQDALLAKFPSSIGQKLSVDSLSVVLSSDSALATTNALGAKEAKQDTQITAVNATNTKLDTVIAKLPSTIGQKVAADSLSVVLATGTSIATTVTGGATEAKQDAQVILNGALVETAPTTDIASSGLNGRLQRIAQRLTSLIAIFPNSLGAKTSAASLSVVLASDQAVLSSQPSPVAGAITTAQIAVGVAAVRATVAGTAPSALRKKLMIKPSTVNAGRIFIGGSTVTTANGLEIVGPDRLEFEFDSGDYYLISDMASQSVDIFEKV